MTDFTRTVPGAHDAATDTFAAPTVSTVTGEAIRVGASASELHRFAAGGFVAQETAVLFWTPTTYGDRPRPGDTVSWESLTWVVLYVDPIAPDGVTIAARVSVYR